MEHNSQIQSSSSPSSFPTDNHGRVSFLNCDRVIANYPSVLERYYKHKLYRNAFTNDKSNQDLLVLAHSNRFVFIILITI